MGGEFRAARQGLAVAFRLRQHDEVLSVAVVQTADDGDGVGDAAVIECAAAQLNRRKVERNGAGRAQHGAGAVELRAVEIFGSAGLGVGHADQNAAFITVICLPVERDELVWNGIEHEIRAEDRVVVRQVAHAEIAAVAAVATQHLQIAPALAGEVGDGVGDAGGNADDVVEHDVMVEQRVHDAAGKYRAEGTAL